LLLSYINCIVRSTTLRANHVHQTSMYFLRILTTSATNYAHQEIETWVAALALYDKNDLEASIVAFQPIADTAKILFNCGIICATLGVHRTAVCPENPLTRH